MEHENHYVAPKYDCLLFDLDDTLYPQSCGLSQQCANNIQEYMIQRLGIDEAQVPQMNQILYNNYGTSMAGLQAIGYDFDNDDYHSYVHGRLPYQNLKPDHVLRTLLLSLPIRKVIFTNADKAHVAKCLSRLGLEDCFEMIVCFETLNPSPSPSECDDGRKVLRSVKDVMGSVHPPKTPIVCKPFEDAFKQAFDIANINPKRTLFFEDSIRNLETGKKMGLGTVLVGSSSESESGKGVEFAVESIHNMKEAIAELDGNANIQNNSNYPQKMAIQTSLAA